VDLIKEAMLMQQEATGFILVGFPKNPRMSNIFNRQVKWPEKIVALEVDNEVNEHLLYYIPTHALSPKG
jgi:adenylate kinase family enzyme